MSLTELKTNQRCVIQKLPELKLLNSLGIREGTTVTVMSRQPLKGPLVVQLGRRCIALGRDITDQIFVGEVS